MSTNDDLKLALEEWRDERDAAGLNPPAPKPELSQAGKRLHDLNVSWGEVKAAHKLKIKADREKYIALRDQYLAELAAEREANPPKETRGGGRRKNPPYSDKVKIAAYLHWREAGKSAVRVALGIASAVVTGQVIEDGKALHEASQTPTEAPGGTIDADEEW